MVFLVLLLDLGVAHAAGPGPSPTGIRSELAEVGATLPSREVRAAWVAYAEQTGTPSRSGPSSP